MTEDQEKLIREIAEANDPAFSDRLRALAQVVLELEDNVGALWTVRKKQREAERPHSLRLQMEHAVEDLLGLGNKALRTSGPQIIVDNLLDILDQDLGAQTLRAADLPGNDQWAVGAFRSIIQTIRRGE